VLGKRPKLIHKGNDTVAAETAAIATEAIVAPDLSAAFLGVYHPRRVAHAKRRCFGGISGAGHLEAAPGCEDHRGSRGVGCAAH
jgi:hypothetical protein